MAGSGSNRADLERRLAELTRRVSELEARLAEMEGQAPQVAAPGPQRWQPPQPWGQSPWGAPPRWQPPQWQPPQTWGPPQQPPQQPQTWGPPQQPPQPPPQPAPQQASEYPRLAPRYADGSSRSPRYVPPSPEYGQAQPHPQSAAQPSLSQDLGFSLASVRDLESRLTGRLLAWVGAAAVVLGAVFFLSLAFSRGWIGPEGRVALGLIGGAAFTGVGAWLFGRRQAPLGHVMVAVGLGVVSLSLFAGTRFYGLYPPEWALAGSFVAAVVAAGIAIRVNSEVVAIFGLLAIAAAPPVMGAGANSVTIAFLGVTIVGTTAIAVVKAWRWLPPTAFLITAPQLVFWLVSKPDAAIAVTALAGYWLLNAIAASADELREHPEEAEVRAEALFLANSTVAIGGGLFVLSGNLAGWQGAYVAAAALAHFAFGGFFVWRRGETYPFGLLVNAIGVTAVAIAIERQFDGPPVAIGWAIEAAVLTAIYGFRRNVYAGGAAAILGGLAALHLGVYEYPLLNWTLAGTSSKGPFAFIDSAGLTLGAMLVAGFIAGLLSRDRQVRIGLLIAGALLVAYALPFELSGAGLVTPWAFEGAVLIAVWGLRRHEPLGWTAAVIATLAFVHLGIYEYSLLNWSLAGATGSGPFPFADSAGLALGGLLLAGVVAGLLSRDRDVRMGLLVAGALLVAYSLPYEFTGPALVAAWAAEGVALAVVWGFRRNDYLAGAGIVAVALAIANLAGYEYPWLSWTLKGATGSGPFPFADSAGLALGCLLVAAFLIGLVSRSHGVRCAMTTLGLLLLAYSLPFELSGVALVAAWAAVVPASVAAEGLLDRLPGVPASRALLRRVPVIEMSEVHWPDSPLVPVGVGAFLAVAHMLAYEMPILSADRIVVPAVPFADLATAAAVVGIASFLLAAAITARPDLRAAAFILATALAAYTMLFELALPYAVVTWCALAIVMGACSVIPSYGRWAYVGAGGSLVTGAGIAILKVVVPVERLGVQSSVPLTGTWFAVNSILAIGATALTLALAARFLSTSKGVRSGLLLASGIALVYLASALVVDFFQRQVGGHLALEELQKQAQVGVSILWALAGTGVFLAGLVFLRTGVREAGLGLLALATAKVFLFDLSYLDVAYRVLSLIGLGLLLLAGAYAYQSLRPRRGTASGDDAGRAG